MSDMVEIIGYFERGGAQVEAILRRAEALRVECLRDNFWPACGITGAVLLFVAAAIVVPP
jgi:hypothetical protein